MTGKHSLASFMLPRLDFHHPFHLKYIIIFLTVYIIHIHYRALQNMGKVKEGRKEEGREGRGREKERRMGGREEGRKKQASRLHFYFKFCFSSAQDLGIGGLALGLFAPLF